MNVDMVSEFGLGIRPADLQCWVCGGGHGV